MRCEERDSGDRCQRQADGNYDSVATRHSFFDEHDKRKQAHPNEMRDADGKHYEHERPTTPETEQRVTESQAQSVAYATPIVPYEVESGVSARLEARIFEGG